MRQSAEQRRLLAVLVADIVGYSRLMAENEADTFYRLKDFQTSLITPAVDRNRGQIVKWTGDGFLATFESAVDAVRAAVEVQSGAAAAGAAADDTSRIRFRIGINVGDVITVPGDVYGDTVNIAARLQTAAAPGGICIARGVRDTVRGKFGVEFENRGELSVKNIPDPVGAFDVVFDPIAWTIGREVPRPQPRLGWRRYSLAAAAVLLLAIIAAAGWYGLRNAPGRSPAGAPLQQMLASRLAAIVPAINEQTRGQRASDYAAAALHKAQAVSQEAAGTWRASGRASAADAETAVLEECQVFFGQPCILLAVDEVVRTPAPDGNWPRRDMPRARYAGGFDPAQIPGTFPNTRVRSDVAGYRAAPLPKAAAYHPSGGRVFTSNGAATQRAAEEAALEVCNRDPSRKGADGRCFLYAVGERVVLPLRLRNPLTEAAQ